MIPQVYLAGPYTGANSRIITANCHHAICVAHRVVEAGAYPVFSHAFGLFCQDGGGQDDGWWYSATKAQMLRCDGVLMLDGWDGSVGAIGERETATRAGMPVFTMVRELRTWVKDFGK